MAFFGTKYVSRVKPDLERVSTSDIDFMRVVMCLFVHRPLANSYYKVDHQHVSFVDDISLRTTYRMLTCTKRSCGSLIGARKSLMKSVRQLAKMGESRTARP